ncbi:fimbria/pilus periplasmic chaperone [Gallibacterium sp. AGMB14963]|uniref:fimbria/pilus periplasmic chaperone n=1 Tax=Gallibacterium faecale TaxID=3019086 RepID=UPI0022F1AF05|nr:fimbria/pilus periplasmic chaperone [Gallibacterium sp. AGMB14963]MDA3978879.1 fimbria/pilus periplasmic chaperone [Gallibacterium sp. AGMB14963]
MLKKLLLLAGGLWLATTSYANIVITGTRIIYPANQKNVSVQLSNAGDEPALVQAWIDNGDPHAAPEQIKTPFVITPPISRVDANKGQTLRVTYTGEPLPNDRESIFYFNILDIPPNPKDKSKNYLQVAIRSRIKLFFRPTNLKVSPEEAYKQVEWRAQGKQLIANNNTPYFITYSDIAVTQGSRKVKVLNSTMISPFSQATFNLTQAVSATGSVEWTVINDYGGRPTGNSKLF